MLGMRTVVVDCGGRRWFKALFEPSLYPPSFKCVNYSIVIV